MIARILNIAFSKRLKQIDYFRQFPHKAQEIVFKHLVTNLLNSEYGKSVGVIQSMTYSEFCTKVPVVSYEDYQPWIEASFQHNAGIISNDEILWYSKSSGTTSSQSKFIPITKNYVKRGHMQGALDTLAILFDRFPKNKVVTGKTLTLGGSIEQRVSNNSNYICGDISAIMMINTPWYAKFSRVPSLSTSITKDFNQKLELICRECSKQNVTSFAGVPSWNLVMLEKILEYNDKSTIPEVWNNIELFIHGGVGFEPYREQYKKLFPNDNMKYIETYNASEGFFGIQDNSVNQEMLLMCDYDIFYEFMPMSRFGDYSSIVTIEGVELGVNYALIISTSAGLWRYMIGDTVMFTSLYPHKIKITGRTKLFLNVFGEEVVMDNCDRAVVEATRLTGSMIKEYMVSPIFMEIGSKGAHQWIVEFSKEPNCYEDFKKEIDKTLQLVNSDYEAKRHDNATLCEPDFIFVKPRSFYMWYEKKCKLGGQNKVPRLSNDRDLSDEFITFVQQNNLIIDK